MALPQRRKWRANHAQRQNVVRNINVHRRQMGHTRNAAHKQQEASTIPTLIAMTISNSTVSDMHINDDNVVLWRMLAQQITTLCASLIFHATIPGSSAAMAEQRQPREQGARSAAP